MPAPPRLSQRRGGRGARCRDECLAESLHLPAHSLPSEEQAPHLREHQNLCAAGSIHWCIACDFVLADT